MHDHPHRHAGPGHNHAPAATQWQTLHDAPKPAVNGSAPADIDLVEQAFIDAFPTAPDATSFLRLAAVPFVGEDAGGRRLQLLRVEVGHAADVGRLTPTLGGGHRYDPLPAKLASRRGTLALVYCDDTGAVSLTLAEARALRDVTPS